MGQHAIFAEHTTVSSATHPCPYIAYFGPIHPSSSNSNGAVTEASNLNNLWGPSVPSEIQTSYAFPAMDLPYHSWEHHSSPFPSTNSRIAPSDQPSILPITQRSARASSEMQRPGFMHPFLVGHRYVYHVGTLLVAYFSVISSYWAQRINSY